MDLSRVYVKGKPLGAERAMLVNQGGRAGELQALRGELSHSQEPGCIVFCNRKHRAADD